MLLKQPVENVHESGIPQSLEMADASLFLS
jgi:hypothetical protein